MSRLALVKESMWNVWKGWSFRHLVGGQETGSGVGSSAACLPSVLSPGRWQGLPPSPRGGPGLGPWFLALARARTCPWQAFRNEPIAKTCVETQIRAHMGQLWQVVGGEPEGGRPNHNEARSRLSPLCHCAGHIVCVHLPRGS